MPGGGGVGRGTSEHGLERGSGGRGTGQHELERGAGRRGTAAAGGGGGRKAGHTVKSVRESAQHTASEIGKKVGDAKEAAGDAAAGASNKAGQAKDKAKETVKGAAGEASSKAEYTKQKTKETGELDASGREVERGSSGDERDIFAQALQLEAAWAAEKAWELREAWASLSAGPELEHDSLLYGTDLDGSTRASDSPFAPNRSALDKDAEDQSLYQRAGVNLTPFEDCSSRLNRLIDMQERLLEENRISLQSKTNKRKRSTLVVNASNSGQATQSATSPTPVSPIQKRNKRMCSKKSLVWKYFSTGFRGQDPIATCNHCGQIYSCDQSTHGTSTLWYHLRNLCPEDPLKGQGNVRKNQGTPKHPYSVEDCRKALADMVIIDEMPFTVVEGVGFRRYSKVLQPRFEPPSRMIVARDCMQRYIEEKPKLKKILKNHRICLTTDTWTSKQNLCCMTLTAHWIDDQWNLQKRILNFCSVADHEGETLRKRVEECLLEWGIDCIFTMTVDNATSNDKMIKYLKDVCKDWKGVVLKHKFLHVRCCAHIVNLVVKSGLEEHNESIDKIRTTIRFVRSSPSRLKVFKKCAELEKISSKSLLSLDIETRWNATYLMLESAEKFEKAFARLERDCKPFKAFFPNSNPPNAHDWESARHILCFLKLFEKVTTRLSAFLHVTSTIVFHDIMLMHAKLDEIALADDPILSSMASFMKLKFQKYWEEEGNLNYLLFIAVILDPRYKLKYLTICLEILYGSEKGNQLSERTQLALDELFGFYAQTISAPSSSSRASNQALIHINVDEDDEQNPWDMLASQFEQHMEEIEDESNDSKLSRYLADKREMRSKEFDILSYWKVNSNKYPILSLMAKDVLAVPASTVPSESAFSTGGRIIDPLRCSLSTDTVEALICAQSWLHTTHTKVNAREAAEELQSYEDIKEEFFSKEYIDSQHHETRWNATYLMLESAEKFEKAFARLERDCKPFKMECYLPYVETRWNATYLVLESAEKFEKAFARLERDCKPFKAFFPNSNPPNAHDRESARRILCFLKLFEKVTTRLSASLHVTSTIVFHDIMLMHAKLDEIALADDPILSSMASFMKLKFQKYWEEEGNLNYLLFIAVILDPRYKLKYLTFCLEILYGSEKGNQLSERTQSALDELFGFYAQTISAPSSSSRASNQALIHINVDEDDEQNPWDMLASQFEQHMEEIEDESNDSELSRYLADKREMRSKEFDILSYWKVNSNKYPILSLMAKDVLAVPASTVPSESAFSTGGRIIDPLRCSLSTDTVEALICAQSWLHTTHTKVNAREAAEELQSYEDIKEEFFSKECIDSQHHDFTAFEA